MTDKTEFLEAIIAANGALITSLQHQRETLRGALEVMINCADHNRDFAEIRNAHKVLQETKI